jgi:serine/threonine-protein kinase
MTTPSTLPPDADHDERLAALLAELGEQQRQGRRPDVDAAAARCPDLAQELRELWAAALFADAFTPRRLSPPPTTAEPGPPSLHSPATPRTFGDYELLDEVGRGGMGVVYKARQKSLDRLVALKMILRGELAGPADLARFQAESKAAAQLDHANIVAVYDAGEHDGQAYFSMRYVEGRTLAGVLAEGPMRPRDAAGLLAAVARAVHYAHERGILHRDLKPSNVLLEGRAGDVNPPVPHVTDFGLAKRVAGSTEAAGLTRTGAVVGTPAYMAPEQVSGSRGTPSPASDVYSLGVILYEMLTGRPPFQAPTPVDTFLLILDQEPVRPRLLNPTVDPDLELVCLKCLQKDPELRYASAAGLAADLEAFLHGDTLSVRSGLLADLWGWFRRAFRETPHAVVLENWGLLWMWHSGMILLICALTTALKRGGVEQPVWYLLLWGGGLVVWGWAFWTLRKRGGPVLFVERQVAHVWGAAVAATVAVFLAEVLLRLPVLTLTPLLAVIAGVVFTVKAGMLSGEFYVAAAAMFLSVVPIALFPAWGPMIFGVASGLGFFVPGLKYHLQRRRGLRARGGESASA